jgi:FkbM family methyltransferase
MEIANVAFEGRSISVAIDNPHDVIQGQHSQGKFYEVEQLARHRNLIWSGSTVLDIGANVGNHSLFYACFTRAQVVFPFEPNPTARRLLLRSREINGLDTKIAVDYCHLAVGSKSCQVKVGIEPKNNLGATQMVRIDREVDRDSTKEDDDHVVQCVTLDDLYFQQPVSFVKMDIEGWEIDALHGAENFIRKHRPFWSIEVNANNESAFWRWTAETHYQVIDCFQDTDSCKTYVLIPQA